MSVHFPWLPAGQAVPVGVSLKTQYFDHVLEKRPQLGFFEVHAENYMSSGGAHHRYLEAICEHYALSLHGVGMSLGSAEGLDPAHVQRFSALVNRYNPALVSEHLAWSVRGGTYLNDLLPLPMTQESLQVVADNVNRLQDSIGRAILVENPSSYLSFRSSEMNELEFLHALCERSGCGLLLDVNNVFVSASNMGFDASRYLADVPASLIGELHLAGHLLRDIGGTPLRIDDHGSPVADEVWHLYKTLIARVGPKPTLIEWDTNIPTFDILEQEAEKAASFMAYGAHANV
ncbi:DUF692 domain-containing protein [Kordiimonas sp.]|uniref:MNIO family bufferin maturase n=1 Tax=Kordiimonas sp. TaxID=1970157 RepID=UPI003A912FB9